MPVLSIVKCKDLNCCKVSRTNYQKVIGDRFLPPPVPLKISSNGTIVQKDGIFGGLWQNLLLAQINKIKVYDTFCPKMNQIKHHSGKTELQRRICSSCGIYYPTLVALKSHSAVCSFENILDDEDNLDLDQGDILEY